MFTLDTRISAALQARPELRALLPAFHPAFEKLNHPVLGRILPRLVSVRDAARVAGVDADALLAVMNLPGAPREPLPAVERTREPPPDWLRGVTATELDLHGVLEAGEEPFRPIMARLRTLAPGEVLTLLTPFEPAPLRSLLEGRGWESHVTWLGEVCRTSLWRRPDATLRQHPPPPLEGRLDTDADPCELDVRGLEPPQPLRAVLAALDDGHLPLRIIHQRSPALLFPRLADRNLRWSVREEEGRFVIDITPA